MNYPVFTHPGQPEMQAQVILASTSALSPPLFTIRGRLPRCIWPEPLTHRAFGRNARSSRAVPIAKMIEEIQTRPFVPWHWLKNQPGMQGGEVWEGKIAHDALFGEDIPVSNEQAWFQAAINAAEIAEAFAEAGYHKQIVNRLLEPFMWIDVLITATDWVNFLWLRDHEAAEPHLRDWARLVLQAISDSFDGGKLQHLQPGKWHLPYITQRDRWEILQQVGADTEYAEDIIGREALNQVQQTSEAGLLRKISAARCARISYEPFDGDASYERELARYDLLVGSDRVHASPTEHQASPDQGSLCWGEVKWHSPHLSGNLAPGWIQARKLIPGEARRIGLEEYLAEIRSEELIPA